MSQFGQLFQRFKFFFKRINYFSDCAAILLMGEIGEIDETKGGTCAAGTSLLELLLVKGLLLGGVLLNFVI